MFGGRKIKTTKAAEVEQSPPVVLHQKIVLAVDTDRFVLIGEDKDVFEILFENGSLEKREKHQLSSTAKYFDILGVIGFVKLFTGIHLVVITMIKLVGQIQEKEIFTIVKTGILPLDFERACTIMEQQINEFQSFKEETTEVKTEDGEPEANKETSRHVQYLSDDGENDDEIGEVDVPLPASRTSSPPSSPPLKFLSIPIPKSKKPVNALISKMKSAFSDIGKRRSPITSNANSDVEEDLDRDEETENGSVISRASEDVMTESITSPTAAESTSPVTSGLSAAAKKLSLAWDEIKSEVAGVREVVTIQTPNDEKTLESRVIREIASLLRSNTFFFSYEYDLTTSLQRKQTQGEEGHGGPLWQQVDKRFWWNEHLSARLIEQELHSWVLPIMQGYIQIETCEVEEKKFDFILISRRSRERAGLRYQRRGLNEEGKVANFVETEQIISMPLPGTTHIVSFLQIRGSIPLFWSQSSTSLKPKPVLERSEAENREALSKHFDYISKLYGPVVCINLAELSGPETAVGGAFRENIVNIADPNIQYVEFDFHKECKGMKYENISHLVNSLDRNFNAIGYFWKDGENYIHLEQKGIFRTNCIDCLDRTNVVQSALARQVLTLQLLRLGIADFLDKGIAYYEQFENTFNDVWANNGDSISRSYAGTSALKGDFTRTGKRNLQGLVNDASNSLARMYQNTFRDYFRQATVDYLLGNRDVDVFQELQQRFILSEPGDADRWAKVRASAIETSCSIVIVDYETKINGWTFLSPAEQNAKRSKTYQEKVVLLTDNALYMCTFHYRLEKVIEFKRIGLGEITAVEKGEYILTTLHPACTTPEDNYGFVVYYQAAGETGRVNSGSVRNAADVNPENSDDATMIRFIAFKAFRSNLAGEATKFYGGGVDLDGDGMTSKQLVENVVDEIVEACRNAGNTREVLVAESPVISLAEATKNTGIITRVGFKVKQSLWL